MKKSTISRELKDNWWRGTLIESDCMLISINKAYRDLCRTLTGFSKHQNHDCILQKCKNTIYEEIIAILNSDNKKMTQEIYDKWHKNLCDKLICFSENIFTYGHAQKWINMTFKYLHLLDYLKIENVYEFCHIPIDSYMLNITEYHMSKSWSKLDDYDEYYNYQVWFREKYKESIPLDCEFHLWLEEAKKMK